MRYLRERSFLAGVVERRLPRCPITQDLFGFIDIVAVRPGEVLGVQTTSRANQAARLKKCLATPNLHAWLASGAKFEIHGWALTGPRGKRKTWSVSVRPVTLAEALQQSCPDPPMPMSSDS